MLDTEHQDPLQLRGQLERHQRRLGSRGNVFDGPMVAAAMLDRVLHRSVVFNIDGESYRMPSHRPLRESPQGVGATATK